MANDVRIEQLWIPDSLDTPDAADFLAAVEVGRRVRMQTWGTDDLAYAPQEKLLEMADPYERQVILVAKIDGVIVGTADIALPLVDNLDLAEFTLDILPEFQRQGVGRQLLEAAEHFARDEGRHTILIDTNHPGATLRGPGSRAARARQRRRVRSAGKPRRGIRPAHRLHPAAHRTVQFLRPAAGQQTRCRT